MNNDAFELPTLTDDGLITPEIKPHSLDKYRAISYFLKIFSTSMKGKWTNRVYIDLFSGAGRSKIEGENKIVAGSPLLSLEVTDKFDKYIFCEQELSFCEALNKRISAICESEKFKIISGDVNKNANLILKEMPAFGKGNTCLSFCLADPFRVSDLNFETIQTLAEKLLMDFLVLIPSNMDIHRNEHIYVELEEVKVDNFLGDSLWRAEWETKKKTMKFGLFVLNYFCEKMKKLGYFYTGLDTTMPVFLKSKNFALYHLAYFSKHKLGYEFWNETKKNINPQTGFDFTKDE